MSTEVRIRKTLPSQTRLLKFGLHLVAGRLLDLTKEQLDIIDGPQVSQQSY